LSIPDLLSPAMSDGPAFNKAPVLGLILAGGLGRRMGRVDKPLQELGGARLIDRALAAAQAQCRAVAINLYDPDAETSAPFLEFGLPLLPDAWPGHAGPLAGVLAGLDYAAATGFDSLLSLPCDCPFLPHDLAARLYEAARKNASGLAQAASGGRVHHVVALWPTRLRFDLRRALVEEGLRKVGEFQHRYQATTVEWSFALRDPFFNVNTPDDLLRAREWLDGDEDEI
jgi:molybdopterin-guanine dinucleotide biosynthesis protein A